MSFPKVSMVTARRYKGRLTTIFILDSFQWIIPFSAIIVLAFSWCQSCYAPHCWIRCVSPENFPNKSITSTFLWLASGMRSGFLKDFNWITYDNNNEKKWLHHFVVFNRKLYLTSSSDLLTFCLLSVFVTTWPARHIDVGGFQSNSGLGLTNQWERKVSPDWNSALKCCSLSRVVTLLVRVCFIGPLASFAWHCFFISHLHKGNAHAHCCHCGSKFSLQRKGFICSV